MLIFSKEDKESEDGDIETEKRYKALDKTKVNKMRTAMRMNSLIKEHSANSQLVLITLPKPPRGEQAADDYYQYIGEMGRDIKRMLMVRGAGNEVITTLQ
jgi:potassium/chloride transporter 4/5/6